LTIMKQDTLSQPSYLRNLSEEIYKFTKDEAFIDVKSMGEVMDASLNYVRRHYENLNMTKLIQSS